MAIASGAAGGPAPLKVFVLVDGAREAELAARVEGQTTDLPVELISESGPRGLLAAEKEAAARAQAAERSADVVVWFGSADGGHWVVNVLFGGRLLQRRLAASSGAMSDSALSETAAVVVRTALRGIAAGEFEGEPEPPPLRFLGSLGWAALLDGSGTRGHHGGELRVGLGVGRWRVALEFAFHPAERIRSSVASIELERLGAGAVAGWDVVSVDRWRVSATLGLSALHFARQTTTVVDGLSATPPATFWSPALRPELAVALRLTAGLWVAAALGGEFVMNRPAFGVQDANGFSVFAALWAVEPRATVALVIDLL